jgi:hypothetical protein
MGRNHRVVFRRPFQLVHVSHAPRDKRIGIHGTVFDLPQDLLLRRYQSIPAGLGRLPLHFNRSRSPKQ